MSGDDRRHPDHPLWHYTILLDTMEYSFCFPRTDHYYFFTVYHPTGTTFICTEDEQQELLAYSPFAVLSFIAFQNFFKGILPSTNIEDYLDFLGFISWASYSVIREYKPIAAHNLVKHLYEPKNIPASCSLDFVCAFIIELLSSVPHKWVGLPFIYSNLCQVIPVEEWMDLPLPSNRATLMQNNIKTCLNFLINTNWIDYESNTGSMEKYTLAKGILDF